MKYCPNCNSECEDSFDLCWNCQYSFSKKRKLQTNEFYEVCPHCKIEVDSSYEYCPNCKHKLELSHLQSDLRKYEGELKIDCLRCQTPMFFKGNSKFHEGTRIGAMGDLFELMTNRDSFDLYMCPKCGKIEFFFPRNE